MLSPAKDRPDLEIDRGLAALAQPDAEMQRADQSVRAEKNAAAINNIAQLERLLAYVRSPGPSARRFATLLAATARSPQSSVRACAKIHLKLDDVVQNGSLSM